MKANQEVVPIAKASRTSRWMLAALIVVAILFVVRSLAPQTIGETVRRNLLFKLQQHYANHEVSIRRGNFDPKRGLILEGLTIRRRDAGNRSEHSELIRIDRLTVLGSFDTQLLKEHRNPIKTNRLVLQGVHANAWIQEDGQFNLASLFPLPVLGPAAPRMDLHAVTLQLHGGQTTRPIKVDFSKIQILNKTCDDGSCNKDVLVQGASEFADQITAKVVVDTGTVDVRASVKGFRFDQQLFERLPDSWTQRIPDASALRCIGDVTLACFHRPDEALDFRLSTNIHDGQFNHRSLPYPLTNLSGRIQCDPGGVTIDASQANLGDARVQVRGTSVGYRYPCQVDLEIKTRGLMLDDRIAKVLPDPMRVGWDKVQPVGRVDVDAAVRCRGSKWQTEGELTCKGVDVRYEKFPYPVQQLVGKIKLANGMLVTDDLSGRIAGNRMMCLFQLPSRPDLSPEKSFTIAMDGPVPIDRTMLRSLTPRGSPTASDMEKFVRSLNPSGSIRLASATFATDKRNVKSKQIDLRVVDGRITYDKFAYPLYNVTGSIEVKDDLLRLKGFRATNAGAGVIQCNGVYQLPSDNATSPLNPSAPSYYYGKPIPKLAIQFQASDVPMDESLRQSLPHATRQVWDTLSPSGVLDKLDVVVTKNTMDASLDLNVTAHQLGHGQVTNRVLSLKPSSLPYRIDLTGGTVRFDGSQVLIESIRASHDASRMSADGRCVQTKDGRWVLSLDLHSGSRLHPDAELLASLPDEMRNAMRRLQLRGPVSVRGNTQITLPSELRPQTEVDWDVVLQLEGNRIGDVGPVHALRGEVRVNGHRDEQILRAGGSVELDSMHVYDLQITGIRGPFSIVDDRLTLGSPEDRQTIQGNMFDGVLELDGGLILSSGNFDVQLAMSDGQVPTLLAEFGQSEQGVTGTFSGQTQLQGNLGDSDLLKGTGAARVSGANLYKLPFLVQVLNLLRISASEDYAFTDGEVEFTLFGDSLTFSDMQLWGDLVSLQGGGTLDRRRDLDLTFNTRVSPKNSFSRVFRPLKSRHYTLWTIDVQGPISNPTVERRALDGVSDALGRWFPGREEKDDRPDDRNANRSQENPLGR